MWPPRGRRRLRTYCQSSGALYPGWVNQTLSGSLQMGSGVSLSGVKTFSGAMPTTQPPDASKMSGALLALISSRMRVVAGPPRSAMKSKSIPVSALKAAASLVASSPPSKVPFIVTRPSFLPASRIVCQAALSVAGAAPLADAGLAGAVVAAGWAAGAAGLAAVAAGGAAVAAGGGGDEVQAASISTTTPRASHRTTMLRAILQPPVFASGCAERCCFAAGAADHGAGRGRHPRGVCLDRCRQRWRHALGDRIGGVE